MLLGNRACLVACGKASEAEAALSVLVLLALSESCRILNRLPHER